MEVRVKRTVQWALISMGGLIAVVTARNWDLRPPKPGPLARVCLAIGRFKSAVEETPTTPHTPSVDTTPGLDYGK
jgi:hypothetical protein